MGRVSYSFYRYLFTDSLDASVALNEHAGLIDSVAGKPVPHRKSSPEAHDYDTFLMRHTVSVIASKECLIFDISKKITLRVEHRYDVNSDDLALYEVDANDTHWTHAVMLPSLGTIGIRDGSGDRLSADSGASRLRSIFRQLTEYEFEYERTATYSDITRAVKQLELMAFSFDARPFNPSPSFPGEQMDALLKAARVAKLTGKAEPVEGGAMSAAEDGLISEAIGLAKEGYGQFGFRGRTSTGTEVAYKKPKMEDTKEGNLKNQAKNATLKVLVPKDDAEVSEDEYIVRTMLEIDNVT